MRLTTWSFMAALMMASPVLGSPASSPIHARDNPSSHGDGLYRLAIAEDGTKVLNFTPIANLNLPKFEKRTASLEPVSLQKRQGVTCQGEALNAEDEFAASVCLQNAAGSGVSWGFHEVAWCTYGAVSAYACNYQANYVTGTIIDVFVTEINNSCGLTTSGFDRCTNNCDVNDLAIGRTTSDNGFCGL